MIEISMEVGGMMCGHCEASVNDAIRKSFQVKKVTSDHKKGLTTILAESDISDQQLLAALEPTGHPVGAISRRQVEGAKPGGLFGFMK